MANGVEKYVSRAMKLRILAGDPPKWMVGHVRSAYIIASTLAAPLWMHRRMLKPKRDEADRLTALTGVFHVLDHDIPITHPFVCGLTVPWNIIVVPKAVNANKGNKWHPDQEDIFEDRRPKVHVFMPDKGQGLFVIT